MMVFVPCYNAFTRTPLELAWSHVSVCQHSRGSPLPQAQLLRAVVGRDDPVVVALV